MKVKEKTDRIEEVDSRFHKILRAFVLFLVASMVVAEFIGSLLPDWFGGPSGLAAPPPNPDCVKLANGVEICDAITLKREGE